MVLVYLTVQCHDSDVPVVFVFVAGIQTGHGNGHTLGKVVTGLVSSPSSWNRECVFHQLSSEKMGLRAAGFNRLQMEGPVPEVHG